MILLVKKLLAMVLELIGNSNTYSTTEKRIGTWIDGKPIYRKSGVYTLTSFNPVITRIADAQVIIRFNGYLMRTDTISNITNFWGSGSDYGNAWIDSDKSVHFASSYQGTLYYTIEYTKTTD